MFYYIVSFIGVPSRCGLYWNEISDQLAKQSKINIFILKTSYSNLLLSSHEIISVLEKNVYKQIENKSKFGIPSCLRYLARVIYKLHLNNIHRM